MDFLNKLAELENKLQLNTQRKYSEPAWSNFKTFPGEKNKKNHHDLYKSLNNAHRLLKRNVIIGMERLMLQLLHNLYCNHVAFLR